MTVGLEMARPKASPPTPPDRREEYIRVRMSAEFKEWLDGFSDHLQLTMTDTVIQGLILLAKTSNFNSPPKR